MSDLTKSLRAVFENRLMGTPNLDGSPSWCLECHQTLGASLQHRPGCLVATGFTALTRLEVVERLLEQAWWSRDLHGCRFCFPRSGQFSSSEMVQHAPDCEYAALARSPEEV